MKSIWNIFFVYSGMYVEVLNILYLYLIGNIFVCFFFDLNVYLKKKRINKECICKIC